MKSRSPTIILPASEVTQTYKAETNRSQCNEEALFNSYEIVLGNLLGTGAFCDVHDLYDVQLSSLEQLDQRKALINEELEQRKREHIHRTRHDRFGNSRYVVKHLRPNLTEDRGIKIFTHAAVDCLREFDILSRLSHPNIVRLWGSAILSERTRTRTNGYNTDYKKIVMENNPEAFFIVLEKLQETLSQRILRWNLTKKRIPTKFNKKISDSVIPLPPCYAEKLRYARDIASALAHIHSQGMVFRDLKPDNVGIASDGTAKLFDFGLCRDVPSEDDDILSHNNMKRDPIYRMSTVGTRRYMSPEMMSGHGYNQKTDSYSWAMVFYEMLSLQKPYAKFNRDMHKILVCQQQGRPHASNDIPWSARDLLKRSWCNDISDRPKMQEICDELEKMVDTVEQQTLPLIERSLRAVLEMAELFGLGNDKALTCIASGVIPCNNDDDSDIICSSYYCAEKTSGPELSVSTAARSVVAVE